MKLAGKGKKGDKRTWNNDRGASSSFCEKLIIVVATCF